MLGILKLLVSMATLFSATCCVALLLLLPLSFFLELPSFGTGGKIAPNGAVPIGSLSFAASGGNLWLFTGELPYRGSIISIVGMWDGVPVTEQLDWSWDYKRYGFGQVSFIDQNDSSSGVDRYCYFPGISYRYFSWRSSQYPWWTLRMCLLLPIALTALLPIWWLTLKFGARLKFKTSTLLVTTFFIALILGTAVTLN